MILSCLVACSHAPVQVPANAIASAAGPLTYTGLKRCTPARMTGSGLPDGDVCAFIYETAADCDFVVAMPAGNGLSQRQSVFGFICKEGSR